MYSMSESKLQNCSPNQLKKIYNGKSEIKMNRNDSNKKKFKITQRNVSLYNINLLKPTGHVMHQQFNLLKPTGYVMHQQFNIQQL